MSKFAPTALIALILLAWIFNSSRLGKKAEILDQKIENLSHDFASLPKHGPVSRRERSYSELSSQDSDLIEETRIAVQALLDDATQAQNHDQFRFQIQTATQALALAQNLSTSEFIALIDQLNFPGAPGTITRLIMARVALREAPALLLTDPPSDLWKDFDFQQFAFPSLLETDPDLARDWLKINKLTLSPQSFSFFRRNLLGHDLKTNPAAALETMTEKELTSFNYLFRIKDPALRENLAKALLEKFPENSDSKTSFAGGILNGVLESKNGDPNEMIRHLNTFFPDDPEGLYRIKALYRSQPFDELTPERIEKTLTAARSISPESEHQMISSAASNWARTNLAEASSWLDQLPSSPLRDSAVTGFIGRITDANPQIALQWATTISDPSKAAEERLAILERWQKKDPGSARAWQLQNE